jgi:hypothetical protein
MPFAHTTGTYNVKATLYAWLNEQINNNKPALLNAARVVVEFPDAGIVPPCWSLHWLGADGSEPYQGGYTEAGQYGEWRNGILEVSCWVTRRDENWRAQLAQMVDAVGKALLQARSTGSDILIKDFYTSATAPQNTTYRVIIDRMEERVLPPDPNPEIERRRLLVYVRWLERA